MVSRRDALLCALGAAVQSLLLPKTGIASPWVKRPKAFQVWGYHPVWMKNNWQHLNLQLWDRIVLFELPVSSSGKLAVQSNWHKKWQPMAQKLTISGSSFDLALTLLDEDKFSHIFSRPALYATLLDQIIHEAKRKEINGIHLDFEVYKPLSEIVVTGYRSFMTQLHRQLKHLPNPPCLSIFLPIGSASGLFDAETLTFPDYVVVQGYDAHWANSGTAGPVAPLKGTHPMSWEKTLAYVLSLNVPSSKILFSVPYFGYEWPVESQRLGAATTGPGITTTYAPVNADLLPRIRVSATERTARYPINRDVNSGSPYYVYQDANGKWHQGWFEDEISLSEKFDFIKREKLAGIAVFPLGYDANLLDGLIVKNFGVRSFPNQQSISSPRL